MYLGLPLEIRSDGEFDFDDTSGDGLNVCLEFESRELMHEFVDDLAHLGELDDFSDLLRTHVIEVLPGELFLLLDLPENLLGDPVILSQGSHGTPLSPLDHLARVQQSLTQLGPLSLHRYFEETPEYSPR